MKAIYSKIFTFVILILLLIATVGNTGIILFPDGNGGSYIPSPEWNGKYHIVLWMDPRDYDGYVFELNSMGYLVTAYYFDKSRYAGCYYVQTYLPKFGWTNWGLMCL